DRFLYMARSRFQSELSEVDRHRGWYYALGILLIVLGVIVFGMAVTATIISVIAIGWILLAAGIVLVVHSFITGKWSGFLLSLAAGALSGMAGFAIVSHPFAGAVGITLMVGTILIAEGVYRSIAAISLQFPNWGWSVVSGIVSIIVGALLLRDWQSTSLWFLGAYVGIDLIIHGFSWIMFASRTHRLTGAVRGVEEDRRAA